MEKSVQNILRSWESSIERYGKIDSWKINESFSVIGDYLRGNDDSREINMLVRQIRDMAIISCFNETLLSKINKVLYLLIPKKNIPACYLVKRNGRIKKEGQESRFRGETKHLFEERLRFKEGMLLRNFDIETERKSDSRKVRRIIEKRMCQAYHRRHKREPSEISNRERYWMKRATAFQLYNIGQIENVNFVSRGNSTHWKRMFDPQIREVVFKKKMSYTTKKDALKAIEKWEKECPNDIHKMHAYQCAICKKWHIGHDNVFHNEKIEYSFEYNTAS